MSIFNRSIAHTDALALISAKISRARAVKACQIEPAGQHVVAIEVVNYCHTRRLAQAIGVNAHSPITRVSVPQTVGDRGGNLECMHNRRWHRAECSRGPVASISANVE